MFAENDALVYPAWCVKELSNVFPNGLPYNFDTMVIKGVNQWFYDFFFMLQRLI